jgi:hypothetical protein
MVTSVDEPEIHLGPTLMVIISALASEYSGRLSIPPKVVLHGLAKRLSSCPGEFLSIFITWRGSPDICMLIQWLSKMHVYWQWQELQRTAMMFPWRSWKLWRNWSSFLADIFDWWASSYSYCLLACLGYKVDFLGLSAASNSWHSPHRKMYSQR